MNSNTIPFHLANGETAGFWRFNTTTLEWDWFPLEDYAERFHEAPVQIEVTKQMFFDIFNSEE